MIVIFYIVTPYFKNILSYVSQDQVCQVQQTAGLFHTTQFWEEEGPHLVFIQTI
ncbi:hypothetical protein SAMN05444355_103129 [Flavobacterium frigoris]|uniref:Uncharacterized protein n=1 Tax=Flavobacterium frigoris TaxID=229204 RepID=A0A1H9HG63_FLAFI|nr:hypothetical protein SAMN05444355_103129 [Flavobacterium frigoris]